MSSLHWGLWNKQGLKKKVGSSAFVTKMEGSSNSTGEQPEAAAQFQAGIELTLSRWPALQMAVENQWGGPHSHLRSQQIILDLCSLFTQSTGRIYIEDVEDLLDDAMLSLNVELQDGSIEEIAHKLMEMHEECSEGNFSSIELLRTTSNQRGAVPQVGQVVDNSDDDSDDNVDNSKMANDELSDMAVDVNPSEPTCNGKEMMLDDPSPKPHVEAEDGWTVVASKKNKGRKK